MGRAPRLFASFAPALVALAVSASAIALPALAFAQVVINEIYPNPLGDDTGTERVEIYNAGSTAVDMTGWAIDDAATHNDASVRCRIPEDFDTALCPGSVIIQPGEFRVIKGTSTAAWANNGGDDIYLTSNRLASATVVDFVHYGTSVEEQTWAALPNGTTNFAWRAKTLCASNGGMTGDVTPPAIVSNLTAIPGAFAGEILLTWTAPGDDGITGTASSYEIKWSYSSINSGNFTAVGDIDRFRLEPVPSAAGAAESLYVFGLNPDSTYFFALRTTDEVPNTSGVSNSPSSVPHAGTLLNPNLGYSVYYGNLHSHTSYSDGVQTPADAYTFARTGHTPLDFLAVTDHNHSGAGMSYPNYAQGMSQAAAANDDGNFVAIYGMEWGLTVSGHTAIYEAPGLMGWENGNYDWFVAEGDYQSLYQTVLAHPPANSAYPPLMLWCHPTTSDFNSLAATPEAKSVVHLMCLVNGPAFSLFTDESDEGNTGFDDEFRVALRKGMRVSPTADQDNHNATWGESSESRTAVLSNAKTKAAL